MKEGGEQINKAEAKNGPIDIDDDVEIDVEDADEQAEGDNSGDVDELYGGDVFSTRLA